MKKTESIYLITINGQIQKNVFVNVKGIYTSFPELSYRRMLEHLKKTQMYAESSAGNMYVVYLCNIIHSNYKGNISNFSKKKDI